MNTRRLLVASALVLSASAAAVPRRPPRTAEGPAANRAVDEASSATEAMLLHEFQAVLTAKDHTLSR